MKIEQTGNHEFCSDIIYDNQYQKTFLLSICQYKESLWEQLNISKTTFWDEIFVNNSAIQNAYSSILNSFPGMMTLSGPKGSGKSTLIHKVLQQMTLDENYQNYFVLYYDVLGRWSNRHEYGENVDVLTFLTKDMKNVLYDKIRTDENLYNRMYQGAEKNTFIENTLGNILWDVNDDKYEHIFIIIDNVDQLEEEGTTSRINEYLITLMHFRRNEEELQPHILLAIRDENYGRISAHNAYTDWVAPISLTEMNEVRGVEPAIEVRRKPRSELVYGMDVADKYLKRRIEALKHTQVFNHETIKHLHIIRKRIRNYTNFEADMWGLANNSFRVYAEIFMEFTKYIFCKRKMSLAIFDGYNKGNLIKIVFFNWLFDQGSDDAFISRYKIIYADDLEEISKCSEKRLILTFLYNVMQGKTKERLPTVSDVCSELAKIGYPHTEVIMSIYHLYRDANYVAKFVNVLCPAEVKIDEINTKNFLNSHIYLMPMGIVTIERVLISFEAYRRIAGVYPEDSQGGMFESSDEVVNSFESVQEKLTDHITRHETHIKKINDILAEGGEIFSDYYPRNFLVKNGYHLERVIGAQMSELGKYHSSEKRSYHIQISSKDFHRLLRRYNELKNIINRDYPPTLDSKNLSQ
ncbi:MAG: ATP-binding protein [Candidatus Marinimicrobia bacterium]|nr:ATP-binding protein [Candidatus Neomarinimicrobiota bacterium]